MSTITRCAALAALVLLSGCAQFRSVWYGKSILSRPADYYVYADLDELLRFGADMARKSVSSRSEECRRLLRHQGDSRGIGVELHLMTGRLFSESCGDARKIALSVKAIPPSKVPDTRVQWLIEAQAETLKRLGGGYGSGSKRRAPVERKQKARAPEPRPAGESGKGEAEKDEASILREKLEAIRAIERKLDKATEDAESK